MKNPSRHNIIPKDVRAAIERLRRIGPGRILPFPVWYAGTTNKPLLKEKNRE